jgi:hypothetical protein
MEGDPKLQGRGQMHERTQEVVPLTHELVREFLEERKLNYMVDKDGDFVVLFETPYPQHLVASFILDGRQKEVLQILIRVVPAPSMGEVEALKLVNGWNAEKRWPRAFYRDGDLYLDWSEDWEYGVTPAILARTCDQVLVGAHLFLERLNGQDLASVLLRMLKG